MNRPLDPDSQRFLVPIKTGFIDRILKNTCNKTHKALKGSCPRKIGNETREIWQAVRQLTMLTQNCGCYKN